MTHRAQRTGFHRFAIGWSLHLQGPGWTDKGWYREIEAPLDSCWILGAMIGDGARTVAYVNLTRPRSARPFTVDDVQRLDRLRPWLAHTFRQPSSIGAPAEGQDLLGMAGTPVMTGLVILTSDAKVVFQTRNLERLIVNLTGESPVDIARPMPARERLPEPILKLLKRLSGAANGTSNTPPHMQISTPYGVVTLEAKWLMPANTIPTDVAKDPKSCLIAVTIELREHALAHAARILRESGATPAQMKVGIHLALGKTKPMIADALGIEHSSVASLAKKLYQTLDIHNSTELATKIWLSERSGEAHRSALPGLPISLVNTARRAKSASIYRS